MKAVRDFACAVSVPPRLVNASRTSESAVCVLHAWKCLCSLIQLMEEMYAYSKAFKRLVKLLQWIISSRKVKAGRPSARTNFIEKA